MLNVFQLIVLGVEISDALAYGLPTFTNSRGDHEPAVWLLRNGKGFHRLAEKL
jgi:hypothetical protein